MNNNQMPSSMIQSDLDIKKDQEKEIKEALEATEIALKHINNALRQINSASDWGFFDTLCGGGCISSSIKHDKIENASREIKATNQAVQKLNNELKDVKEIEFINISDSTILFDVFFDNIFSDLKVQSKIAEAESKCRKGRRELESIKKNLNDRLQQYQTPTSKDQSEKVILKEDIKKDQKQAVNEAFEATNKSIDCLQKLLRCNKKLDRNIGGDMMFVFGVLNHVAADDKLLKCKLAMNETNKALKSLEEKLKDVEGIDTTISSQFLEFKNTAGDVLNCNNIMYDKHGGEKLNEVNKCCLETISQIEAVRNDLKERLVKYQN